MGQMGIVGQSRIDVVVRVPDQPLNVLHREPGMSRHIGAGGRIRQALGHQLLGYTGWIVSCRRLAHEGFGIGQHLPQRFDRPITPGRGDCLAYLGIWMAEQNLTCLTVGILDIVNPRPCPPIDHRADMVGERVADRRIRVLCDPVPHRGGDALAVQTDRSPTVTVRQKCLHDRVGEHALPLPESAAAGRMASEAYQDFLRCRRVTAKAGQLGIAQVHGITLADRRHGGSDGPSRVDLSVSTVERGSLAHFVLGRHRDGG